MGTTMPLPSFLKKYFWDVSFKKLSLKKNAAEIIGRILEYGDPKAVQWLRRRFKKKEIADVLFRFRFVSPKSANFWALIYDLPREKILCLKKHYLKIRRRHWSY